MMLVDSAFLGLKETNVTTEVLEILNIDDVGRFCVSGVERDKCDY